MKSFTQFLYEQVLTEAKIDDYKEQEKKIPIDHDENAQFKKPGDIIDHFHSFNPTGDINHTASILTHDYHKHIPGLQELHDWLEECEELLVDEELKLRLEEARTLLEANGYFVEEDY